MVEIYLDKLIDLLQGGKRTHESNMNKDKLEIREDPDSKMIYIQNARMKGLTNI